MARSNRDRAAPEMLGDGALRWRRDPQRDARALLDALRAWPRVLDAVVTETHAAVIFDPKAPPNMLEDAPWEAEARAVAAHAAPRLHRVRVRYDGPDLEAVAALHHVTAHAIIEAHAAREYVVKLVGFLPGFAYLGDVDESIATPRKASPRPRVPACSVAIAARYTGIYPFASSGGWNLIGTAIDFAPFDVDRGALFALGDRVRFEATS